MKQIEIVQSIVEYNIVKNSGQYLTFLYQGYLVLDFLSILDEKSRCRDRSDSGES